MDRRQPGADLGVRRSAQDQRHLADDLEANRAVWRAFATHVAPNRRVDLVIDTESVGPAEAALTILGRIREPV